MSTGIGISPAVMINRMAYENGAPENAALAEVARLRMRLAQAQVEETAKASDPDPAALLPANGAEVDRLI